MARIKRASHRGSDGSAALFIVIAGLTLFIVIVAYIAVFRAGQNNDASGVSTAGSSPKTVTAQPALYKILSPATVPPKVPECSQPISFSSNGNSGPVSCANGYLNTKEWHALVGLEPKIMTLGYGPTAAQVQSTLCADVHANISNPIEETAYRISSLYYGWHFSSDPSIVIQNGTCVNVDD